MDSLPTIMLLSVISCVNAILESINLITSHMNLTVDLLETLSSLFTFAYFFVFLIGFKSVIHNLDMSCYDKPSLTGFSTTGKLPSCI